MKKGIIISLIFVLSVMFGASAFAQGIGVVDSTKIFSDSKIGQAGFSRILAMQQKAEAELVLLEERIDALEESEDDKLMRKQIEFQGAIYTLQGIIDADQEAVLAVIQENFTKALEQIRKDKQLSVVFAAETLLSFDPAANVTDEVIKLLDSMTVTFPAEPVISLPAPAAATAPASPAAPAVPAPATK